jgi:hypothetical protein
MEVVENRTGYQRWVQVEGKGDGQSLDRKCEFWCSHHAEHNTEWRTQLIIMYCIFQNRYEGMDFKCLQRNGKYLR